MRLIVSGTEVPVQIDKFPAGESLVRINPSISPNKLNTNRQIIIIAEFKSNDDLVNLLLLTDAARRLYGADSDIDLVMPYFPYARQDRVCNVGESLSVKVIADLINAQKYRCVVSADMHSDVGVALVNNLAHRDMNTVARELSGFDKVNTLLVSPDAGANKKVQAFAKQYGFQAPIRADKVRNVKSGEITGTEVYSKHVGNRDFLILDDICDGGRTFIELAKELRKLTNGKIYLYVTHGLFTKGMDVFEGVIDQIFTANLMAPRHPLIKELS